MAQEWFYTKDGKSRFGPFSAAELKALAASAELTPIDMVWKEGMAKWSAASKVKGLFATSASAWPISEIATEAASTLPPQVRTNPQQLEPSQPSRWEDWNAATDQQGLPTLAPEVAPESAQPIKESNTAAASTPPNMPLLLPASSSTAENQLQADYLPANAETQMRPSTVKARVLVFAGAALLGVLMLWLGTLGIIKMFSGQATALKVSAREIEDAYAANAVAADEKYKRKLVQIEGALLSSPAQQDDNRIKIRVSGNDREHYGFNCYFRDSHKRQLAALNRGEVVALKGLLIGQNEISDCQIVEAEPIRTELSASDLGREWSDNWDLVTARYKGKTIQVTGKVVSYRKTRGLQSFPLWLSGEDRGLKFDCLLKDPKELKLRTNLDEEISVRGIFEETEHRGFDLVYSFRLRECELVKAKPVSFEMSADELRRSLNDEREVVHLRYLGKELKITGVVSQRGGNHLELDRWIGCSFEKGGQLKEVREGQTIAVKGFFDARPSNEGFLIKCQLVK